MLRLGYTVFYVADVRKTVDFYTEAFGLLIRYVHPSGQYAEMATGETLLAFSGEELVKSSLLGELSYYRNRPDAKPIGAQPAFIVDDLTAAIGKAVAAGAILVTKPDAKPWGQTVAFIRDINGVLVELCTPPIR
jgi:catechol 2,3-dioxygenase-like lactoylglutathione lyase family enzyme